MAAGPGTTETRYQTEDGRWWREGIHWSTATLTTGTTIGYLSNGYVRVGASGA